MPKPVEHEHNEECGGCGQMHSRADVEEVLSKLTRRYNLYTGAYLGSLLVGVGALVSYNPWLGFAAGCAISAHFFHINMAAVDGGRLQFEQVLQVLDKNPEAVKKILGTVSKDYSPSGQYL